MRCFKPALRLLADADDVRRKAGKHEGRLHRVAGGDARLGEGRVEVLLQDRLGPAVRSLVSPIRMVARFPIAVFGSVLGNIDGFPPGGGGGDIVP